ncbi:MAG: hypothetical protein KVP17_004374 [Porospora cf. gigantea B]|nr:MAG: hypothetical protein KVP17_004374 [Porospora cf. gigantea B]
MASSTLMLASFEETNEHLFESAVHQKVDDLKGVSECIIMGKHVSIGTGSFEVLSRPPQGLLEANRQCKRSGRLWGSRAKNTLLAKYTV